MKPALCEEDIDLLQRWCGVALVGSNLVQVVMLLTGTAGGGKGTFIRVLRGIIGPHNMATLRTSLLGTRFELGRNASPVDSGTWAVPCMLLGKKP
jgi:phage/plasmid-associated DNA primase